MPDISSRAGAVEETTGPRRTLRRSLLIATICFGVLVLANLAIFGLLALRSVSERVLRETLVHTQEDADDLARRIEAQLQEAIQPLKWVKTKEVVDTFLNERDTRREIYNRIVIFDSDGNVLQTWEDHQSGLILTPPSLQPTPETGEIQPSRQQVRSEQGTIEIVKPVVTEGKRAGLVQIGIAPRMLEKRIAVLRQDLVWKLTVGGLANLLLLTVAYFYISRLLNRARRVESQALQSRHLAEIGGLASGLAHEIRNPLNALNINFQMMEEDLRTREMTPEFQEVVQSNRKEIRRLSGLVSNFLLYAKPKRVQRVAGDVNDLVREALQFLERQIQAKDLTVETDLDDHLPPVPFDPEKLRQSFRNLVENALAVSPPHGKIRIATANGDGETVRIEVRDWGAGIPAADLPHLFRPFFTRRQDGTGLGLAIASNIVRDHGGEIRVSSTEGEGSRFTISLPVQPPEERDAQA